MYMSLFLPILVTVTGVYLLIKLRFFFIIHPVRTAKKLCGSLSGKENRRSLMLALAGTLGVGNIFGVASGIIIGGAGSVFWMLVASVFSMVIKYSETLMAEALSEEVTGGMHKTLPKLFSKMGEPMGMLYAVLCFLLALFMGSAIQTSAITRTAEETLGVPPYLSAVAFLVLVVYAIIGGVGKIERLTEKVIPLTTIIYIILSISAIFINRAAILPTIYLIFTSAMNPLSAGGGIFSFLCSKALSEGYARGILSNEAGAGTSALAHTRSKGRTPAEAGLAGICEVFFDTTVLCLLTALAILTATENPASFSSPMALVRHAFYSSVGQVGAFVLFACIFAFAYSTVICWYYYGGECFSFITRGRLKALYPAAFLSFIFVGAFTEEIKLLPLTDTVLLMMSVMTLMSVVVYSEKIREYTKLSDLM